MGNVKNSQEFLWKDRRYLPFSNGDGMMAGSVLRNASEQPFTAKNPKACFTALRGMARLATIAMMINKIKAALPAMMALGVLTFAN